MAATPATIFGTQMTKLVGNTGGGVQSLPNVDSVGGRRRGFIESLIYGSWANPSVIGVARLPLPFIMTDITVITDTSTGSTTLAFGDPGNGNSAKWAAAAAYTSTDNPSKIGKTAALGVEQLAGFDSETGVATSYTGSSGYGGAYTDVIMTTGGAQAPAAGNLRIMFEFMID